MKASTVKLSRVLNANSGEAGISTEVGPAFAVVQGS